MTIVVREIGLNRWTCATIVVSFIEFNFNCCLRHLSSFMIAFHLHLSTNVSICHPLSANRFYHCFPRDQEVQFEETKQWKSDGRVAKLAAKVGS